METDEIIAILKELREEEEHLLCLAIEHHNSLDDKKYRMKRMRALSNAIRLLEKGER